MRGFRFWLGMLLTVMLAATLVSAACAATVEVKPSSMNGWVADAFKGQDPGASTPTYAFTNNAAPPYRDAFYMNLGFSIQGGGPNEEATNEIWFGTNQFNGVKVSDITTLEYSTFTEFSGNLWESHTSMPIRLVLTVKTDGQPDNFPPSEREAEGPKNWIVLMFSPWDPENGPALRTWDRSPYGMWQTWNVRAGVLYVGMDPNDNMWQTWYEFVNNYPNATLEFPHTYADNLAASGFFDPWKAPYPAESRYNAATLTGTSLSFQAGARRTFDGDFGGAWWKEQIGLKGYVDMLKIGVSGNETTFDFQADTPPGPFYTTNNKNAVAPIMSNAEKRNHFTVFGKIVADIGGYEFMIDDGSGVGIKLKAPGLSVLIGDYVKASGLLRHAELEADDIEVNPVTTKVQPTLFTDAEHVTILDSIIPVF